MPSRCGAHISLHAGSEAALVRAQRGGRVRGWCRLWLGRALLPSPPTGVPLPPRRPRGRLHRLARGHGGVCGVVPHAGGAQGVPGGAAHPRQPGRLPGLEHQRQAGGAAGAAEQHVSLGRGGALGARSSREGEAWRAASPDQQQRSIQAAVPALPGRRCPAAPAPLPLLTRPPPPLLPPQASTWLGGQLGGLLRLELRAGDTLLLPSGWPHAVSTPEAAVAVGEGRPCAAALPGLGAAARALSRLVLREAGPWRGGIENAGAQGSPACAPPAANTEARRPACRPPSPSPVPFFGRTHASPAPASPWPHPIPPRAQAATSSPRSTTARWRPATGASGSWGWPPSSRWAAGGGVVRRPGDGQGRLGVGRWPQVCRGSAVAGSAAAGACPSRQAARSSLPAQRRSHQPLCCSPASPPPHPPHTPSPGPSSRCSGG
jgi:hypothetical protein